MSIPSFLKGQVFVTPPYPTTSFAGKTIIITGANTGLGLDCAKHLARLGAARLILACRSVARGEKAAQSIDAACPGHKTSIAVWALDLGSYASVLAFADRVNAELERLDGVIENAGVLHSEYSLAEGNETTLTVNVISTFLLAILLLPKMRESASRYGIVPHVPIVGSIVHAFAQKKDLLSPQEGRIFPTLNDERTARMGDRYNLSKLLVILCLREFAAKLDMSERHTGKPLVVVNNPAPGWCKTELFRQEYKSWPAPQKLAFNLIGRESEEGSRTLVHAVTAGKESHGQFLSECLAKDPSSFVRSKEGRLVQERVWCELAEMLERIRPGVIALI